MGCMVGAPACGWVKTGRTPSAGNTEKATNPRENEQVENSVPWFDRDKMACAGPSFTQVEYLTRMGWHELKLGQPIR